MSIVVAVPTARDIVVAAEGLEVSAKDGKVHGEMCLKTAALNSKCCFGFTGFSDYGNRILARLVGKEGDPGWTSPGVCACQLWEDQDGLLNTSFDDIKNIISDELKHIGQDVLSEKDYPPAVLLAGESLGKLCVCRWGKDTDWKPCLVKETCFCAIGALEKRSPELEILHTEISWGGQSMEANLVRGIRKCAQRIPGLLGRNISTRRMSKAFALKWHLASSSSAS